MSRAWLFLLVMNLSGCGCTRIDATSVGLMIDTAGDTRGVQNAVIVSGWQTYNAFTKDVVEITTVVQTVVWEGAEAINFGSVEGVSVSADVSCSFRIEPDKAPTFYRRYRQPDLATFAHGFLRNQVRDSVNEVAGAMPVVRIYGEGKSELLHKAHAFLSKRMAQDGILVDQLTFNNHLRLPPNVQNSINQSIQQTQDAERARNRVAQVQAEAQQRVAQAKGEGEAKQTSAEADAFAVLRRAESQAKATLMQAEAVADGNKRIRESLTPQLIDYEKVQKWDGKLPMIGSGGSTLLDLRTFSK